ncbi:MAG: ABC transporter permease [Bacteroidales bacterium]|nr:ABC transporter permease [Bacteroidales bacterium]
MIWKTAWKNVWRNKVRSLVVIISVTIGIFGGIFSVAVMNGAIEQRVDAAINEEIAHIHINDPAFRDNYDVQLTIPDINRVLQAVNKTPGVKAIAPRVVITGMANTATKSTGVQIMGIDPAAEKEVFRLYETTLPETGDFFDTESRHNLVYIGQDLAKELNIIRYRVDESVIESLAGKELPETVLEKLTPYMGYRFKSEKAFKKEMKSVLTLKEQHEYGKRIRETAWSFRERSKMTLTFLDRDQIQTGAVFRIAGIFDVKNNMYEMGQVFVRNQDLMNLTGFVENEIHQLVIKLEDIENTGPVTEALSNSLPGLEVMNWKEIQPDLAMMTDMVQKFYAILMVIILAALAFGIVNTMLMVVLERTKELGMLTAIGMNKKRVFSMIMLESIFLSLFGGVVGMVVSRLLITFTATKGINFQSYEEGFEAMGYSAHIYPVITPAFFIMVTILIIITGILSSIYPALKALKLDPAEALRTE